MSSVFLSNVDDYLGPSQACVNPLFSTDKEQPKQTPEEATQPQTEGTAGKVVPRRRRKRIIPGESGPRIPIQPKQQDIVKASIADCLACSGCVTTAETVLLEERHSLDKLKALVDQPNHPEIVLTISPASWADLLRHLKATGDDVIDRQRQLTTLLQQTLSASVVMDGNVPLEWSRHEAALEFCRAWRAKNDNGMEEEGAAASLPLISSSCPATVCLVEKSIHGGVPHLAVTKSPMSIAGAFWRSFYASVNGTNGNKTYFHLAVMPCHDKKLEASRTEFAHGTEDPDVNMVITTQECLELMQQRLPQMPNLNELPLAPIHNNIEEWKQTKSLSTSSSSCVAALLVSKYETAGHQASNDTSDVMVESSGAYADYIFRFAARDLFGVTGLGRDIWTRVVDRNNNDNNQKVSARVAAQRRREYYQAALYSCGDDEYATTAPTPESTPVLQFAIAYGMQTMQRALQPFQDDATTASPFDYIEAMACPSGCINGGGQLRVASRETPTETRHRVAGSRASFRTTTADTPNEDPPSDLHTHYRVIAPLQHSLGAAAGVAVQDTQW